MLRLSLGDTSGEFILKIEMLMVSADLLKVSSDFSFSFICRWLNISHLHMDSFYMTSRRRYMRLLI